MINSVQFFDNAYGTTVARLCLAKTQSSNSEKLVEEPNKPIVCEQAVRPGEISLVKYLKEEEKAQNEQQKQGTEKSEPIKVEEKDPVEKTAELLIRDYITQRLKDPSILKNLTKVTPATLVMAILGVDLTEDGKVIFNSSETGQGGNYKESFKELIDSYDEAIKKAQEEGTWETIQTAFMTGLGFIPTSGSVIVTNTLAYVSNCMADVLGESEVELTGSSMEVVGTLLDSIGGSVVNVLGGAFGSVTSLFKGDAKGALDSLKNMGKKFKEMGKSILNSFEKCGKALVDYSNPKTRMEKKVSRWRKFLEKHGLIHHEEERELSPEEMEKIKDEALKTAEQISNAFGHILNPDKNSKENQNKLVNIPMKAPLRMPLGHDNSLGSDMTKLFAQEETKGTQEVASAVTQAFHFVPNILECPSDSENEDETTDKWIRPLDDSVE